jgi:uncharacterized protein (TIGR02145 family)
MIIESQKSKRTLIIKVLIIGVIAYSLSLFSTPQKWNIIKIGEQEWMDRNLTVSVFRNGDIIPEAKTQESWENAGHQGQPVWCYYENDQNNEEKYGKLYNWYALNDSRGLAPEGWHIPNNNEWQILIEYLGGDKIAGGKMKETGNAYWKTPNKGATNESEFTASAGGLRYSDGEFNDLNDDAYFWSSSEYDKDNAWYYVLGYYFPNIYHNYYNKQHGFSVRCIRD